MWNESEDVREASLSKENRNALCPTVAQMNVHTAAVLSTGGRLTAL